MLPNQRTELCLVLMIAMGTAILPARAVAQSSTDDLNTSELKVDAVEPRIDLPEVTRKSNSSLRVTTISLGKRKESRDGLVKLAQEAVDTTARRLLSSEQHTPWQMTHALLGLRQEFNIMDRGQEVNGLDWIAQGQVFNGDHWFEKTVHGGRAHPYSVPYAFEGHANQTLAVLSMCGLEVDHEFGTADGTITLGDMIEHAKATCDTKRDEPTWTLWALSRYLPPDAVWRNEKGEVYSIERLVQEQTARPLKGAACGGTHGLFALAHARNVYLREGKPLRGVWLQAENKLRYYINTARRLQNSNGSLSSNYLRGRQYNPDFNKRMASAGHVLEFLMLALPQSELNQRWVRRAVEATARDLLNNRKEYVKCSPLYHSVNALNIYLDRVNPREEVPQTAKTDAPRTAMLNPKNRIPAQGISQSRVMEEPTSTTEVADVTSANTANVDEEEMLTGPQSSDTSVPKSSQSEEAAEATDEEDSEQESMSAVRVPRLDRAVVDAIVNQRLKELEAEAEAESDRHWSVSNPERFAETGSEEETAQSTTDESSAQVAEDQATSPTTVLLPLKPVEVDASADEETPAKMPVVPQEPAEEESAIEAEPKPASAALAPLMAKKARGDEEGDAAVVANEATSLDVPSTQPGLLPSESSVATATVATRLMTPGRLHTGQATSNSFSVERDVSRTPLTIPMTTVSESRTLARQQAAAIQQEQQEKVKAKEFSTVPRGINDNFLSPDLDAQEWVNRFEVESREIYACRDQIVKAIGLSTGQSIADIGAGTGLFTGLFSKAVGEDGSVYAIDISPRLIAHLEERVAKENLTNVKVVRNEATSTQLVTRKVDKAFVCDTYHHFERPDSMLKSIHKALNEGGELVVIDFERIPGESRDWVIGHVRAGKATFRAEIEASGFEFVREVSIDGFKENYLLIFRKK